MGIFDWFLPEPPIQCPGCEGVLTGWQGKHTGDMALFVWQQGEAAPSDQAVDLEVRIDGRALSLKRLGSEILIYGGECSQCGFRWWDTAWQIHCHIEDGVWTKTEILPPPVKAQLVEGRVVCSKCDNGWKAIAGKTLYLCSACQRLVQIGS